jgi:hypothetical protein
MSGASPKSFSYQTRQGYHLESRNPSSTSNHTKQIKDQRRASIMAGHNNCKKTPSRYICVSTSCSLVSIQPCRWTRHWSNMPVRTSSFESLLLRLDLSSSIVIIDILLQICTSIEQSTFDGRLGLLGSRSRTCLPFRRRLDTWPIQQM